MAYAMLTRNRFALEKRTPCQAARLNLSKLSLVPRLQWLASMGSRR
jgi:hypothetical protein